MKLDESMDGLGEKSERTLLLGYLSSKFETGIRNPLNSAILEAECTGAEDYTKCDEIPFDFERRRVSIVVMHNGQTLWITKGAPESVIRQCSAYESAGRTLPFITNEAAACLETFHQLSSRVTAFSPSLIETSRAVSRTRRLTNQNSFWQVILRSPILHGQMQRERWSHSGKMASNSKL